MYTFARRIAGNYVVTQWIIPNLGSEHVGVGTTTCGFLYEDFPFLLFLLSHPPLPQRYRQFFLLFQNKVVI
jgi:hypothetical protein